MSRSIETFMCIGLENYTFTTLKLFKFYFSCDWKVSFIAIFGSCTEDKKKLFKDITSLVT